MATNQRPSGKRPARLADPHAVLGVKPGASPREITAAFRRLAKATHPDHNPGADGSAFREARAAYAALKGKRGRAQTPREPRPRSPWTGAEEAADYARRFYPDRPDPATLADGVEMPDPAEFPAARRTDPPRALGAPKSFGPPPAGWRPGYRPPYGGTCRGRGYPNGPHLWDVPATGGALFVYGPDPDALAADEPADPFPPCPTAWLDRKLTFDGTHPPEGWVPGTVAPSNGMCLMKMIVPAGSTLAGGKSYAVWVLPWIPPRFVFGPCLDAL